MKNFKFFTITFAILMSIQFSMNAQGHVWLDGLARADGFTIVNGVEFQFQQAKCNGADVVFLKVINNNNHAVELTWEDAVLNSDNTWVKSKSNNVKSIKLDANQKIEGACEGKAQTLLLNLSDFSIKNNFKYFRASQLNIKQL